MKNTAGLIYGPMHHYIDHLAPLCHLLGIPLVVTEEDIKNSIQAFYPKLEVLLTNYILLPEFLVHNFSTLFVCTPRVLFDEICFFAQKLNNKRIHTIWCPHGNSDKGHKSPYMQALDKEDAALLYGQKMIDFLQEKKAFSQLKIAVCISNFRKAYYLKHQQFYDHLVQIHIQNKLNPRVKTVLYAPTWEDAEKSCSFYSAAPYIIENLPQDWTLLIKPHPNLLLEDNEKSQKLLEKYAHKDNILFILDFPPIHPLLALADLYIGDMSSIGYDFLSWNKPMFFLNEQKRDRKQDPGLFLYRCGVEIVPEQYKNIYDIIQKELPHDANLFSAIRKEIDLYTFGPELSTDQIKEKILSSCFQTFDETLNFF